MPQSQAVEEMAMTDDELLALAVKARDCYGGGAPWERYFAAVTNPAAIIALIERNRAEVERLTARVAWLEAEARGDDALVKELETARKAEATRLTRERDEALQEKVAAKTGYMMALPDAAEWRARAEAAESALAAVSDDGADRVISDLLIASAPYADMDETGRLPKAREQAERLLNEPDLSAKQRYANHYEEQIGFLVERFAEALSSKLRKAEEKYQYQGAWRRDSWHDALVQQIRRHMDKGDPLDVAAYCAFAWHHGWTLAAPDTTPTSAEAALAAAQKRVRNLEATIGWVTNMTGPGNRAVINAIELLNSIHDQARSALKESGNGDETVRPDQQVNNDA